MDLYNHLSSAEAADLVHARKKDREMKSIYDPDEGVSATARRHRTNLTRAVGFLPANEVIDLFTAALAQRNDVKYAEAAYLLKFASALHWPLLKTEEENE